MLDWIKSCDSKSSIVIAGIGVFLTISITDNAFKGFKKILDALKEGFDFSSFIYILFTVAAISFVVYGIYNLILVLVPRLNEYGQKLIGTKDKSLYYFGKVSNMDYTSFKQNMLQETADEEIEDLLSQIYINAHICNVKFMHYRKGIIFSFTGIIGLIILYGIGLLLVAIGGL